MASKKDIDLSGNMDDFGDFDFNVDESGVPENKVAKPSKMRSDYIPAMSNGFLNGLKKELANKFPETAAFVGELNSAFDQVKSMTSNFTSEATPMVRSMGRSMRRLMPLVKPFMPGKAYSWVTGKLSSIPEEQGELSEEERMGQQISADINAALQGADASAGTREQMSNIVGGMRHKATIGGIYQLSKQMNTVTTFLTTTMTAYMKKDLELQYRQLYAQRDIASTLRATAKLIEVELKHITHNTGLPESVKAEAAKKRGKFVQSAREFAANRLSTFMKNVKEQVFDQVKETISMVGDALSGGSDMMEMMQEMGEDVSLKGLIIKGVLGHVGSLAGSKFGSKIAPYLKAFGGGGLEGATKFGMDKLFEWVRHKAEQDKLGPFSDIFLNADPGRFKPELKLTNAAASDPNKPVAFDISTRDAIVNVIPSWLSKIHAVTMDIKDPTKQHEEMIYDPKMRGFVSVNDTKTETAKDLRTKFKDLLKPTYDHNAIYGAMASKESNRSGANVGDVFKTLLTPEVRKQLDILFQNIARIQNGFHPDWLDHAVNTPDKATGEEKDYYDNAIVGLNNGNRTINTLLSVLAGDGKDGWDREMFNMVDNAIRQIHRDLDPTALRNQLEDILNNGTEAQKKLAIKILNEGLEPDQYIATEKGINLVNFEKFMANQNSRDNQNSYATVRAVVERKLSEARKQDPTMTEDKLLEQDPELKKWIEEVRKTDSYQSTYNASVADELYGEDFFKVYFSESGELYTYYKRNRELLLFDTIIAANAPMQTKAFQEAAEIFTGWYERGSKAKDEVEVREISESARLKLGEASFFMKIAQPIFSRYTSPKQIKEIYEGIKQEGDKTTFFPGLADRIKVIKSNEGLRRMYGESLETVVRRNTRAKTRKKGEKNVLGQAAASAASAIANHFGPIGGFLYNIGKTIFQAVTDFGKDKYDEYKEGGFKGITLGGISLDDYKKIYQGVISGNDEEIAKMEWKDPTPEEFEERVKKWLESHEEYVKKHASDGEEKLKAHAAKEVQKEIEQEHKKFDARKARAIKAVAKAKKAKGSISKGISVITGKLGLTDSAKKEEATPAYTAPTDEERSKRVALKQQDLMAADDTLTPEEAKAQAEKAVDADIAKEKEEFESKAKQASDQSKDEKKDPAQTFVDKVKEAYGSSLEAIEVSIEKISGPSEERTLISNNVAKIYLLLEKKFGETENAAKLEEDSKSLIDKELQQLQEKRDTRATKRKGPGFFRRVGGALAALNPFKASPAAIAAKYQLDPSSVESAFHGDFQRYFEYRKEMDAYIASRVGKSGLVGNFLRGTGSAIGGIARGFGSAARGAYNMLGGILPAGIRAGGSIIGGLYHGGGAALGGIARGIGSLGAVTLPAGWKMIKGTAKLPFKIGKKILGIGRRHEDNERYYNLYRKDKLGTPGWEADPIVSVKQQEAGVYDAVTDGRIEKTDDITGPVYRWKGVLKKHKDPLISKEDWAIGIVNVEGKSISDKAKEHEKAGPLVNIRTGGLFGGLLKGLGFASGGLANLVSSLVGFDIKAIGGIAGFTKKAIGGIGRGIANFLGLGDSPKGQKRKYSVILGKMDEMIAHLKFMRDNTAVLDTVNNEARDDANYGNQKSQAEVKPNGEKGKGKAEGDQPWWKKLMNFLTDPKGIIGGIGAGIGALAGLVGVVAGIGVTAALTYKVVKQLTDWWARIHKKDIDSADLAKGVKDVNTAKAYGTLAKLTRIPKAPKVPKVPTPSAVPPTTPKPKTPVGPSKPTVTELRKAYQQQGMSRKAAEKAANQALKGKRPMPKMSPKPSPVPPVAPNQLTTTDKVDDAVRALRGPGKQSNFVKNCVNWLTKYSDDIAKASADGNKVKMDFIRKWLVSLAKTVKDINCESALGFFGVVASKIFNAKIETVQKVVAGLDKIARGFTKVGTAGIKVVQFLWKVLGYIPIAGRLVRSMVAVLGIMKVVCCAFLKLLAAIPQQILLPLGEALVEWFDRRAMEQAYEHMDDKYMQEYRSEADKIFGYKTLGMLFKAVDFLSWGTTFGYAGVAIKATIESSRYVRDSFVSASIADIKAQDSASDTKLAQKKRSFEIAKKAKDAGDKRQSDQIRRMENAFDATEDEVETDLKWYNSLSGTRKADRQLKVSNKKTWFLNCRERMNKNKWLMKDLVVELLDIVIINFTSRKALAPSDDKVKGWGYQINEYIDKISLVKSYKELEYLFTHQMTRSELLNPQAQMHVINRLKNKGFTVEKILAYAKQIEDGEKQALTAQVKTNVLPPNVAVPTAQTLRNNRTAKAKRYFNLDAAFNSVNSATVFDNAHEVFESVAEKKWPENGVYEAGDAIFVICTVKCEDDEDARNRAEAICMMRQRSYLQDRYDLPNNFRITHVRQIVSGYEMYATGPAGCYHSVNVYKKSEIYNHLRMPAESSKAKLAVKSKTAQPVTPTTGLFKTPNNQSRSKYIGLDAAFGTAKNNRGVYQRAREVFNEVASKKWPEDGVYEYGSAVFVVTTCPHSDKDARVKCVKKVLSLLADRYPNLPEKQDWKDDNGTNCTFFIDGKPLVGYRVFPESYIFPRSMFPFVYVFDKNKLYKYFTGKAPVPIEPEKPKMETKPQPKPQAIPPKEATAVQTVKKEEARKKKAEAKPKGEAMAKAGDIAVSKDEGNQILDDGTTRVLLPFKDETVDEYNARIEKLNKTITERNKGRRKNQMLIPYTSYRAKEAQKLIEEQKAIEAKKKEAREKAAKEAAAKVTPPAPVVSTPKAAPQVTPNEQAPAYGPRRAVVENMASSAAKQNQYPREMMDYFKSRLQYNPADPQAMIKLMMALNDNMAKVADGVNKGNEIATQNGENANANAKLLAKTQAQAATTTVNAINVNGKQNSSVKNNIHSPVVLAQGAAQ